MSSALRLEQLSESSTPPRSNGEFVFDEPWHARAFGMAAVLAEEGALSWEDFRLALISHLGRTEQTGVDQYYGCWLDALIDTLIGKGTVETESLAARAAEFAAHTRAEVF